MENNKLKIISEQLSGMTLKEWDELKEAVEKMYSTASENITLADAETVHKTLRHRINMPYILRDGSTAFGVCPKCGGRYSFGENHNHMLHDPNDIMYHCWDCGFVERWKDVQELE